MQIIPNKSLRASVVIFALFASIISTPTAQALYQVRPATHWINIYAGAATGAQPEHRTKSANLEAKSKFNVNYDNFPDWARKEVQAAVDVWAANFQSAVPVNVEATWGRSSSWGILGSARPSDFYSGFTGAPDSSLWYPSALANALAGRDLDKSNPEIIIQVNANAEWNVRGDGTPRNSEYDLESVFLHEIAHGVGFLSNDSYDSFFNVASLDQPTPFDAYAQTSDGHRLADLPTPSPELATALTTSLVWSGPLGTAANGGVNPKLYTPTIYEAGSSVSHLDEATFSKTGPDSVMTPNLDPGEIFKEPGPLLLAMLQDLRNKPPAGIASGPPGPPRNVKAYVADSSAFISFDPPTNVRTAPVAEYVIKNVVTGAEKKIVSSPVLITGLKNGSSYSFTVTAKNSLGISDSQVSNSVIPEASWKSAVLDSGADGSSLATAIFNGQPAITYSDSKIGNLKLALYNGKTWKKLTIDGAGGGNGRTSNDVSGQISMCVNGTGKKQTLHIFYSDITDKDLRYATYDGASFSFEIIDGNGGSINEYSNPERTKTSSDVSVSNACVATAKSIQVFYRDESQGVLLGAVKNNKSPWAYELIDGDRKTDNHTTGDVGFHLKALLNGSKTIIAYDSVVSSNQKKQMTSGAVRVATREGNDANTWKYQTLDISKDDATIFGYDIALTKVNSDVQVVWLATSLASFPRPNQIRWTLLSKPFNILSIQTENYGTPAQYLASDGKKILFSCQDRLCVLDTTKKPLDQSAIHLVKSTQGSEYNQSAWVLINKFKYVLTAVNGKLSLLKP